MPITGACDTIAWVGWTHEETDAHHGFQSLRIPLVPLPQTSTLLHDHSHARPCVRCIGATQTVPAAYDIWLEADPPMHPLCDLLAWRSIVRLAPPLNCWRDLWQNETLRLGTGALTVRWSKMDYQCEVSYSLPPALHYLWWQIAFSGGAYGARTQHHTIRILCLRQVTLHWNTPPRMVMPSMTGVHRPYQEWWCFWYHGLHWPRWQMGRTRWQSVTALSGRWVCMALCVLPTYPHRIILLFLARFGFGFHLCLHILGCFDTCWTITEAPSRRILLFDWTGWPQLPWHWCNPQATSCQMGHSLFYSPEYNQVIALYGYTAGRCCLYRAMVRVIYQYVEYPMHWCVRLGEQYNCESIQVTIHGDTSRCQGACHQFLLNALACSVCWSPPDVVYHWGCRLASLHRGIRNPGWTWAP